MPWFLNPAVCDGHPPLRNPEFRRFVARRAGMLWFARGPARGGVRPAALVAAG